MDLSNINKDRKDRHEKKRRVDLSTMVYGKVPPQAKDMEEAILGALMLQKDAFDVVAEMIKPEYFYVESHQHIFTAMLNLSKKSNPIDILTVSEELRRMEMLEVCGGSYAITKLTNSVVSAANITSHCHIVLQKYIQRELIRVSGEIIADAYEDAADPFELIQRAENLFSAVSLAADGGEMVSIDTVIVQTMQKIKDWMVQDTDITGVSSGFNDIDKATRGWQDTDLIILAARPSVGKTAFVLNLVKNAAIDFQNKKGKKSVGVWSLEMKAIMLVLRMLSESSEILLHKIQTGRLSEADMMKLYRQGVQVLSDLKIFFDDNPGLTIAKLRSRAKRMKKKNNLGLIVIDYLQLMSLDEKAGTREQEVSKISRELKKLAMEIEVPIIALSQMSRAFESRTGEARVPQLSDLRESGGIEQDADLVMFLWGPTDAEIAQDVSKATLRQLKIAKARNGVLKTFDLEFRDEIQKFGDIDKFFGSGTEGGGIKFPTGNWRPVKDITEPSKPEEKDEDMPF